jgi:hypothetical protein
VGGASSTSAEPPNKQSRALAYNSRLKHLAVADNKGGVSIRQLSFERNADMNTIIKTI